jgi:predicted membrane channel-forming protein YqfA (hemolysin III family)
MIVLGGVLYSVGFVFFISESMPYQVAAVFSTVL